MTEPTIDDRLTRSVIVPTWMVYLFTSLMSILSAGAVGTVCTTVHHVFVLSQNQGEIKRDVAALKVKETDIVSALNNITKQVADVAFDVKQLQRDMGN
jgi:ABC-type sugar transport system substrate-binding protein